MRSGTKRRIRESSLRYGSSHSLTRVLRQRTLPTNHCHAGSTPLAGAIREYQSDSSSKRPALSAASVSWYLHPDKSPPKNLGLTTVIPYQDDGEGRGDDKSDPKVTPSRDFSSSPSRRTSALTASCSSVRSGQRKTSRIVVLTRPSGTPGPS